MFRALAEGIADGVNGLYRLEATALDGVRDPDPKRPFRPCSALQATHGVRFVRSIRPGTPACRMTGFRPEAARMKLEGQAEPPVSRV